MMSGDRRRPSSLLKMISGAAEDRKITAFPRPYGDSPYSKLNFSETTRKACLQRLDVNSVMTICKAIVLGDVCVGKTCIVNRFCHKIFESSYKATIGVDFEVEKFDILGVPFNLQIWDTAGQERFKCIAQSYYRSSHAVLIVFDVTNITTLGNCKLWMKEALDASTAEPYKFIIGTKKDLLSKASYESVEKLALKVAKTLGAEYWPLSSKTGENINGLFHRIAVLVFDDIMSKEFESLPIKTIASDSISFRKNNLTKPKSRKMGCDNYMCN